MFHTLGISLQITDAEQARQLLQTTQKLENDLVGEDHLAQTADYYGFRLEGNDLDVLHDDDINLSSALDFLKVLCTVLTGEWEFMDEGTFVKIQIQEGRMQSYQGRLIWDLTSEVVS